MLHVALQSYSSETHAVHAPSKMTILIGLAEALAGLRACSNSIFLAAPEEGLEKGPSQPWLLACCPQGFRLEKPTCHGMLVEVPSTLSQTGCRYCSSELLP